MQRVLFERLSEVLDHNVDDEGLLTVTAAKRRLWSKFDQVPDNFVLPELRVHSGPTGLIWSLAAAAQAEAILSFYDGVVGREPIAHSMEMRLPAPGPRGDEFELFYVDGAVRGSIGSQLAHGDGGIATLEAEPVIFRGQVRMALRAIRDLAVGDSLTLPHYQPKPQLEIAQDGAQPQVNKPPDCSNHCRGRVADASSRTKTWVCTGRNFSDHISNGGSYAPPCVGKTTSKLCYDCSVFYDIPIAYCDDCFNKHRELLHAASSLKEMPALPGRFTHGVYGYEMM